MDSNHTRFPSRSANPIGRLVVTVALDVTDPKAVHQVFHAFAGRFGKIDRIIVNAGIGTGAPLGTGEADLNGVQRRPTPSALSRKPRRPWRSSGIRDSAASPDLVYGRVTRHAPIHDYLRRNESRHLHHLPGLHPGGDHRHQRQTDPRDTNRIRVRAIIRAIENAVPRSNRGAGRAPWPPTCPKWTPVQCAQFCGVSGDRSDGQRRSRLRSPVSCAHDGVPGQGGGSIFDGVRGEQDLSEHFSRLWRQAR